MDANGLINFDTLHELRLASCRAFDKNSIFGTYCDAKKDDKDGAFQWMTYHDFNALVDKTRSVLKDIGTCTDCGVVMLHGPQPYMHHTPF